MAVDITDSSRISPPLLSSPAVNDGVARNDSSISLDSQATGLSRRCGRDDGAAPSPDDLEGMISAALIDSRRTECRSLRGESSRKSR